MDGHLLGRAVAGVGALLDAKAEQAAGAALGGKAIQIQPAADQIGRGVPAEFVAHGCAALTVIIKAGGAAVITVKVLIPECVEQVCGVHGFVDLQVDGVQGQ